ncbi:hypothetical protein [Marimonas arenosa]|uniref:Uncharacterized protein n=1 Tax=Marimonas arenosa TaxID=1795305 RepID=A0AAE3WDN1_9RHOB|nr:hypothetical protein [Marimonas arenosa]MDQ2090495.1 hypothetical protein [Marimonas arenosa]
MVVSVLLPALGLILCAVVIPIVLERWVPESVGGMIVNGVLTAVLMTLLSTGYFLWAYQRQDTRLLDAIGFAPGETLGYFLRLGLSAGLIWGPVMILMISTSPRRWKENVW